ncbi:hypothetical protein GWK47_004587 [Chionoecetes opilio]|uniref:Uncharacterized protein n=1 Tax=Chionoecetes opilio TaxID=41210 RepID=A0A8J5D203_CHIOP|nr:hypothetical protein GWK47_004587 [Chionoecetes opilio]
MMTSTRERAWWLIGHPECEITRARLPSKGQVLRKFYFHHGIEKKTKPVAAKEVIEAVLLIWGRAGIPTSALRTAKEKLLSLVAKYESLQKHRKRASETARMKEEMFKGDLEDLFDVVSSDALDRMTVEEDKAFLRSQREDRATSSMAGLDCITVEAQERKKERERAEEMRKERSKKEKEAMTFVVLSGRLTSSSSSTAGETDDSDVDFTSPSHPKRSKVEGAKFTALCGHHLHLGSVQSLGPGGDGDDGSLCNGIWAGPGESLLVSQHHPTPQNQESGGHRQVGNDKHSGGDSCPCPLGREVTS